MILFESKLFRKTFSVIVAVVAVFTVSLYLFSVPLIIDTVFEMEERAGKTILNNVYDLIKSKHDDIEAYQALAVDAHKQGLKNVIAVVESRIARIYEDSRRGLISEAEAKQKVLREIKDYRYGNNDYVYILAHDSFCLSHPDPALDNKDLSGLRDVKGKYIVAPIIQAALADREGGFSSYFWKRLGENRPIEKLVFSKQFHPWGWVVATGVYIDDIEKQVALRKEKAIEELREKIYGIKIAKSGYLYVFRSDTHMLIHPNKQLENTKLGPHKNPLTGESLARELMEAAQKPDGKLVYKWDKPNEPGNYVYDKISWVRYFKGFDWYIGSSVYTDELKKSSHILRNRILIISALMLVLSTVLAYFFVKKLVNPIESLSVTALKVKEGDLSVRSAIDRDDEIGVLAREFNNMVEQLRLNIEHVGKLNVEAEERAREIEQAYEKLKQLDAMKSTFLSTVSHELRTPLTSVLGFAKIIKGRLQEVLFPLIDSDDRKVRRGITQVSENLDIIISEGLRLTSLINDVLDLAKMEAGRTEWKSEPVCVQEVIWSASAATAALVQQKALDLRTELDEDLPEILGDRDSLIQVVINLVSNAVKFTERGAINCRAKREGEEIRVSVIDSGIGIVAEDLDAIFEKFKQVGDTLTDRPRGTGLGLPICRQIIEHHGGRIWAESEPGKGSAFHFTLLLKPVVNGGIIEMDYATQALRSIRHAGISDSG